MTARIQPQIQSGQSPTSAKPTRNWRIGVALCITRREYQLLRRHARKHRLPFATWLTHLALAQLQKPL